MYSHGSSARVGIGKRGHGGRNYRPPKPKKNNEELVPPPLKACDCMIQLDIAEYAELGQEIEQQRRRLHLCFEGNTLGKRKTSLKNTEKTLRSLFGVHLVVPGRNQKGPLALAGKSIQETLPAVDYLMQRLVLEENTNSDNDSTNSDSRFLLGRIMRNVKDPNDFVLSGRFLQQRNHLSSDETEMIHLQPYWLFESDSWNAMVCPLSLPRNQTSGESNSQDEQQAIAEALQIGFDNLRFRLGNAALSKLRIFLHPCTTSLPPKAFATGDPSTANSLYREIRQTKVNLLQSPEN
uniref:Uncharacterized protein n=1 Tax=Pseudo-nitzschia delicatissima TaxID=44447 RepID=A0A7S0TBN1_9STRA|mmetsp:Transcript_40/g.93  ORF Transcript_40/g.93 Transcript_40/m.93 type:complete len:293 (+) Transcript_40:219-1097(+)